jgi:MFS transporter, ACS family, glucarate transporter
MDHPASHVAGASRVRFGVLTFISTLSILTYLDRTCISRVQDDMMRDLGLNKTQMGLVFGAFYIGYGLFEVPAGWMGDVWGPRRVLTRIVLWWSAFTALTGAIGWFSGFREQQWMFLGWQVSVLFLAMLLVRFLFGCGEAGGYPNLARVVGTWFPFHERGRAQGAIWFFARLGGAMAPLLIGRLTALAGWQQAFWIFGVIGVLWCIVFYVWFRDKPEQMPGCNRAEQELIRGYTPERLSEIDAGRLHPDQETGICADRSAVQSSVRAAAVQPPAPRPEAAEPHTFPPLRPLLASGTMWALCTAAVFVNLAWHFFPTWQPRYFKDMFGISMEGSELLVGLPYLCGALGAFVGGSISDRLIRITGSRRWGRALVGVVGFGGAGVCAFCLLLVTEAWQAVALLCLVFLINDLAVPVIWAAGTDISGRFAGTVTAIVNTAGCIGGFLCPVLMGTVLDTGSEQAPDPGLWRMIFTGLACSWLISGLAWLFIDSSRDIVPAESGR